MIRERKAINEGRYLHYDVLKLTRQLASVRNSCKELVEEKTELKDEIASLEVEVNSSKEEISDLKKLLADERSQNSYLETVHQVIFHF